ncbi:hypothetical protein [Pseudonocardia xishanensis]|uniref:Uncharacterized protein n=1 Tax=Pseudonocardia xishanensis TaxID=630995 RepID=A0ABP8RUX0_9PSEU
MKRHGPVLTLLAVLAVGVSVFAVNTVVAAPAEQTVTPAAQSAPAADSSGDAYGGSYGGAPAAPQQAAPQAAAPQAAPQTATGSAPTAAPAVAGTFAGRSAGNEVTLAVGVEGGRVVAYVCDGKKIESWFEGTDNGGELQLSGVDGELTANATEGAVLGTVSVGDKSWPFSAQPKRSTGPATDHATLTRLGSA